MSESPASYMIKVLSLSKLLNSDENLDPRYKAGNLISTYKCYSELTYPIAEMAVIKRSQFFESQIGLTSSPSIGIELVNILLKDPETLEDLLVQIGSINNITKSLFEEISKIDKDKIHSPIAESYYTEAITLSMTLARSSDVFFNAVIKSCLPPEEIKETLPTVITKPQSNEILNVSQPAINSDVTTRETENNSKSSEYSYSSQNYQDSNTKNKSRNETDNLIKNEQLIKAIEKHFIYQSRKRLGILIFITSGLYMVYWYYKHWALFKEYQKDSKINLIICSIFSGISILGLARRIKKLSLEIETEEERETKKKLIPFYSFKPVNLLGFSFGAGSTWRFPFPFDLLGLFASIAIADIMYQGLLSCIEKYLDEKKKLSFLSGGFRGRLKSQKTTISSVIA